MLKNIEKDLNSEEPPSWASEPDLAAIANDMSPSVDDIHNYAKAQNGKRTHAHG